MISGLRQRKGEIYSKLHNETQNKVISKFKICLTIFLECNVLKSRYFALSNYV